MFANQFSGGAEGFAEFRPTRRAKDQNNPGAKAMPVAGRSYGVRCAAPLLSGKRRLRSALAGRKWRRRRLHGPLPDRTIWPASGRRPAGLRPESAPQMPAMPSWWRDALLALWLWARGAPAWQRTAAQPARESCLA